jgi:hypothetical protein
MIDIKKLPLPYSVTKSKLVDMYINQKSVKTIRKQINEILKERKISIRSKYIQHLEFMEYIETYGVPKGYEES